MGKSRLAPMKSVTVPRMELSAAVVATRLGHDVTQGTQSSYFWIVLQEWWHLRPALHWKSTQTISNSCGKSNSNHSRSIVSRPVAIRKHSVNPSGRCVKRCVSRLSSSLDSRPRIPDSASWWMATATCWQDCCHTWQRSGGQGRNSYILNQNLYSRSRHWDHRKVLFVVSPQESGGLDSSLED